MKFFEVFESEIQDEKYQKDFNNIGWHAHYLVASEHLWVRINSIKIINLYLKAIDETKIAKVLTNPFAERINEVDLKKSAFFKIENAGQTLDEFISYFHQNYWKWSALNFAEEYAEFQNKIDKIT